jgi:hypothetical protein
MTEQRSEQQVIRSFAAAFRLIDQHKRELQSKNKCVRARAQHRERKIRQLDREIAAVVSKAIGRR